MIARGCTWKYIFAISVILLVGIALVLPIRQSTAVLFQPTETPTPILENTLKSRLELTEIDMSCKSNCWSNFEFNKTEMEKVYDWFDEKFSVENFQRDNDGHNNFVGVNIGGNFGIRAFSDSQSPPLLRAFYLTIHPTTFRPPQYPGDISEEHLAFILPKQIFNYYGLEPTQVFIRRHQIYYSILFDYHAKGVSVRYSGRLTDNNICISQSIEEINWLAYASNEISGLRILNELGQYEGASRSISIRSSDTNIALLSNDNEIQEITEQFLNSDCLNLESYRLTE